MLVRVVLMTIALVLLVGCESSDSVGKRKGESPPDKTATPSDAGATAPSASATEPNDGARSPTGFDSVELLLEAVVMTANAKDVAALHTFFATTAVVRPSAECKAGGDFAKRLLKLGDATATPSYQIREKLLKHWPSGAKLNRIDESRVFDIPRGQLEQGCVMSDHVVVKRVEAQLQTETGAAKHPFVVVRLSEGGPWYLVAAQH